MSALTTAQRVERRRQELERPALVHVTTTIVPVQRSNGTVCPVTGSKQVVAVDEIPDLSVLIRDDGERINRWELRGEDLTRFDALASKAEHYAVAQGQIWHVPIVFYCPASHVEDLLNDETQVIYWSGGWRSGKSYRGLQWWARGWVKYGSAGERFWLMGPQHAHAFRLMQKLFLGRKRVPPLIPTHNRMPVLARTLPNKTTERDLSFEMIDGSIVELQHAHGKGGHLEGESVRRILFDEAWMVGDPGPYEVALGRVMEDFGQVGLASVPDEENQWIYERVVAEFDKTKHEADCQFKVIELSGYDNPWIPKKAIERREKAYTDPVERENKVWGKWTRRGRYYYADVWNPGKYTRDEVSHEAPAWGLGNDITEEVLLRTFGASTPYGGAVDFSDGGRKATTRLWFRLFGEIDDWSTWNLVFLDEEQTRTDARESARESRRRREGAYEGCAVVGDCNGFHHRKDRKRGDNDAYHWAYEKFKMVAPIRHRKATQHSGPSYENPRLGSSRTAVRELMRRGKIWINAGGCPGLLWALEKAPNHRKLAAHKNTWVEIKVYGFEDCMRYVVWRIFSRYQLHKMAEAEQTEANGSESP